MTMISLDQQIKLSESRIGRIKLHIEAFKRDKKIRWHLAGIMREIKNI